MQWTNMRDHSWLSALRLAPPVFVRPGELRQAKWSEIDLDRGEWRFFVTKTKIDHLVPLSRQAIAILKEVHPLTGRGMYVFPTPRSDTRPLSNNAVLSSMRRMGFDKDEMSGHGFRARFLQIPSTISVDNSVEEVVSKAGPCPLCWIDQYLVIT